MENANCPYDYYIYTNNAITGRGRTKHSEKKVNCNYTVFPHLSDSEVPALFGKTEPH